MRWLLEACELFSSARAKSACRRYEHYWIPNTKIVGIVTQPDKPVGREQRIEPPPIKKAITRSGGFQTAVGHSAAGKPPLLEVLQPAKIKDPQAIEEIRGLRPM